jgi:hypothetical protein
VVINVMSGSSDEVPFRIREFEDVFKDIDEAREWFLKMIERAIADRSVTQQDVLQTFAWWE